jgi:hypothetical protein
LLLNLGCFANTFPKDTCYTQIDSTNNRTITICEKSWGKTPAMIDFGDGKVYITKYRTRTVTVLQGDSLVYKLYRKTKLNTDILHLLKYEIIKFNVDNSKETLRKSKRKSNRRYQYIHQTYDIKGNEQKAEIIDSNEVKWDDWVIFPEDKP